MTTQPPAPTLEAPYTAEEWLRHRYGAYRGHFAWRELEQAFEAGRASLAKEPASPIALTDAQIDQLHRNSYESTVALARFRRIVRLVEGAHRIGDAAPKGQGEKP